MLRPREGLSLSPLPVTGTPSILVSPRHICATRCAIDALVSGARRMWRIRDEQLSPSTFLCSEGSKETGLVRISTNPSTIRLEGTFFYRTNLTSLPFPLPPALPEPPDCCTAHRLGRSFVCLPSCRAFFS